MAQHDQQKLFLKVSLSDQLACLIDFAGKIIGITTA